MATTGESAKAAEQHAIHPKNEEESPATEHGSDQFGGPLGAAFGESPNSDAKLVGNRALSLPVNSKVRGVALRQVQRSYGNHFVQRALNERKTNAVGTIQRECACGGTCAKCQSSAGSSLRNNLTQPTQSAQRNEQGPGVNLKQNIVSDSGGEPLDRRTRGSMESHFGSDFSEVRIHRDSQAAASAETLNANAYTIGRDIYFASGRYAPETSEGKKLLAHELVHTLQQSSFASSGPADSLGSNIVVDPDKSLEHDADQVAAEVASPASDEPGNEFIAKSAGHMPGHPALHSRVPNLAVFRNPNGPGASIMQMGAYLESEDPIARGAALQELRERDDEQGWRALILAQQSPFEDVRTEVQWLIVYRISQHPEFEVYLNNLANSPRGVLSDLAVRALARVGSGFAVDVVNYRKVIHQRLDLARHHLAELDRYLWGIASGLVAAAQGPDRSNALVQIDTLEANVDALPIEELWELGLKASTLMDHLAQVNAAASQLLSVADQFPEEGAVRELVRTQLIRLLLQGRELTGAEDDPAFADVLDALSGWPGRFASALVEELHKKFSAARKEVNTQIGRNPMPSFKGAWAKFKDQVIVPLRDELDTLLLEFEYLKPEAANNPDGVFAQLQALEAPIQAIGERVVYTLQATNMENLYTFLIMTDERVKDVMYPTELELKLLFAEFAQLANDRDKDPEAAQRRYQELVNSPGFKSVMEDIRVWEEILAGEEAFGRFLLDVLIVIASLYTGGLAAGVVRGIFGTAVSLGGRIAVGTLAFGADVTAFTLTSRGLRWAVYGESFTEGLGGDLLKNALMFGFLKGSAAVYERFAAPILPQALRPAGAMTTTFAAFQTWSVGYQFYDVGEWIGITDPRFWQMAAHNAVFLGAIHLGMKITKPLVAPVQESVLQFQVVRHNQRCAALETQIRGWSSALQPTRREGVEILGRAKALYKERLEVLREINKVTQSKDFTAEELAQAEAVIRAQVQAVENTLAQSRFNLSAHETAPNTFYYEGNPQEIQRHFEGRAYEVIEAEATTGRVRLRGPNGEIIDLIRSRETPSEDWGRSQEEAAADQQIAAASTVDTYLSALRTRPHRAGSAGIGWDYSRFRTAPRGRGGMWQPGDPIDMPSSAGVYPTYDTARSRYWRNRAHFEMEARARGEVRHDPAATDPMRRMSDANLQNTRRTGTTPPDPRFPGRTMELEHSGVPQRVETWLQELGFPAREARQLAEVSSPGALLEVIPLEHAFFDFYAQSFGSQRADINLDVWSGTRAADVRVTRPLEPMRDATIQQIVREAQARRYDFNRNDATRKLRDALRAEINERGLSITLP